LFTWNPNQNLETYDYVPYFPELLLILLDLTFCLLFQVVIFESRVKTPQVGLYALAKALSQQGVAKKIQVPALAPFFWHIMQESLIFLSLVGKLPAITILVEQKILCFTQ
jgi:hypothetical protein